MKKDHLAFAISPEGMDWLKEKYPQIADQCHIQDTTDFLLRSIPIPIWKAFKIKCTIEGISASQKLRDLIEADLR
jgi:hypothetical protein